MSQQTFQNQIQAIYEENFLADQSLRSKAWSTFKNLGLPSDESEVFKYIPLHKILSQSFSISNISTITKEEIKEYVYPECSKSFVVMINGYYSEEHSCIDGISDNVVILDLAKASKTYGAFLNNHWTKFLKEESDPFTIINAAIHKDGLFIYAPPNQHIETPIQIIHIVNGLKSESIINPRIQVFVGKSTQIKIFSSFNNQSDIKYFTNQLIDFSIDENAHVFYCHTVLNSGEKNWYFDAIRATQKRNSQFKSININNGSETYRNDYRISLIQDGANAELDGIWMLSNKKETHTNILIDHQAPHCTSRQFFKGVLKDFSRSSFEGKILVQKIAQKTDAFQLNNNLLLDDKAQAFSKPNLEIFADDVKASHGATMGKLNEEQEFYLLSRGFSKSEAKNLLIYGFCEEIVSRIQLPSLMKKLTYYVQNFMA